MAVVFTVLANASPPDDASAPYTITVTPSRAPVADSLVILTVYEAWPGAGPEIATITGLNIDWQEVYPNRQVDGSTLYGRMASVGATNRAHEFRGMGSAPTADPILITYTGQFADPEVILTEVAGVEPGGTAGSEAVAAIQWVNTAANGTSGVIHGGRFVDTGNVAYLSCLVGNSNAITVDANYTLLANQRSGGLCSIAQAYRLDDDDVDATHSWTPSASWQSALWEIVPAGGVRGGGVSCVPIHAGNNNANPLVTDSVYPPAGITIFECCWRKTTSPATNPTLTGTGGLSGMSWTKAGEVALSATVRLGVWYSFDTASAAGTLSLAFGANQSSMAWRLTTFAGVGSIRNLVVSGDLPGTSTAIAATLAAYASVDSGTYACFAVDDQVSGGGSSTFWEGLKSGLPCTHQPGGFTFQRSLGATGLCLTSGWSHSNFTDAGARTPGIDWTAAGALHGAVVAFELVPSGVVAGTDGAVVEIGFGSGVSTSQASIMWTDVTTDLWGATYTIRRGRSSELDTFQAGTVSLTLLNVDRKFDPAYPLGPYYGQLLPMTPLRIRQVESGVSYNLFTGYITGWPQDYASSLWADVPIDAADGFRTLARAEAAVLAATAEELSGARVGRLLDGAGWPTDDRVIDVGIALLTADVQEGNILSSLRNVEAGEGGQFYINADGQVVFEDRLTRINDTRSTVSQATFGDNGTTEIPYSGFSYDSHSDRWIRNDVRRTRVGGGAAEQVYTDASSIAAYGRISDSKGGLPNLTDEDLASQCDYLVTQFKDPQRRVEKIEIRQPHSGDASFATLLGLRISDQITVKRRPQNVGALITDRLLIEGISITQRSADAWTFQLFASPFDDGTYFVLDDATDGVLA